MQQTADVFLKEVTASVRAKLGVFLKTLNADEHAAGEIEAKVLGGLTEPPEFQFGQAAIPCHALAKIARKPPVKIAEDLASLLAQDKYDFISKVEAKAGYLNFFINFESYGAWLLHAIGNRGFFKPTPLKPHEKIVVEWSQPNTHKALHIGHLRNMIYGESVCKLLEYVGHEVVRVTYPGDLGAHIAKVLWFIKKKGFELPKEHQAEWLGARYAEADDLIKEASGTPQEAINKGEVGEVLKSLQNKTGPDYELYLKTREWSLAQMRSVYDWIGIKFDQWYFESECDEPSRELVVKKFKEGFFKESEGAVGLDLSAYNLGFALFLKGDGNGLYLTKDLELIRRKFADPAVTSSIYVVDARQKLHFQQLFKTAELMGYPQAARSIHLSYETVTTEKGEAFSSRKLNGAGIDEVRSAMEQKVVTDFLENYRGQWSDEEIKKTAKAIALGALKYGFLHVDASTVVRFVLNDWLKLDGDTGPYLQYVHARCQSISEKQGRAPASFTPTFATDFERELVFHLSRFNAVVTQAAIHHRPSAVAGYLFQLCKLFNRFYKECPIKTAEGDLRSSRLSLVESTSALIKEGLALLGIEAPNRM